MDQSGMIQKDTDHHRKRKKEEKIGGNLYIIT
jgi:hypothetical protein